MRAAVAHTSSPVPSMHFCKRGRCLRGRPFAFATVEYWCWLLPFSCSSVDVRIRRVEEQVVLTRRIGSTYGDTIHMVEFHLCTGTNVTYVTAFAFLRWSQCKSSDGHRLSSRRPAHEALARGSAAILVINTAHKLTKPPNFPCFFIRMRGTVEIWVLLEMGSPA